MGKGTCVFPSRDKFNYGCGWTMHCWNMYMTQCRSICIFVFMCLSICIFVCDVVLKVCLSLLHLLHTLGIFCNLTQHAISLICCVYQFALSLLSNKHTTTLVPCWEYRPSEFVFLLLDNAFKDEDEEEEKEEEDLISKLLCFNIKSEQTWKPFSWHR